MQKSSIVAGFVAASVIAITIAVNFKIKSEYLKGNVKKSIPMIPLPPFKYLKNNLKISSEVYGDVDIHQEVVNGIWITDEDKEIISYKVVNDTLVIEESPSITDPEKHLRGDMRIGCTNLKGIITGKSKVTAIGIKQDSFFVQAYNLSTVSLNNIRINTVTITAKDNASVQVEETDTLPNLNLQLKEFGDFTARNVIILNKQIDLTGKDASITLVGRSLENFGIANIVRAKH